MSKVAFAVAILVLATLVAAPAASAHGRVFIVGGWGYGPGWYGPYYWGWPGYGYVVAPYAGQVKLVTHYKDARVYVDGGYAGLARKLKKFSLVPGNHDIELRDSDGRVLFSQRVDVIAGKTVELHVG